MKVLALAMLGAVVVLVVVAAWVAAPAAPAPSPVVASPLATEASPSSSPALTPPEEATADPSSVAIAFGGTWVMPTAGAKVTSSRTTLAARPTGSGPGETTFTKVVFSGRWTGGAKTILCKATKPSGTGDWRCEADLLAHGVPPGKVTFSFDVFGVGVPAARSPDGPRRVTYAVPPPKPTDTRWRNLGGVVARPNGQSAEIYRLRWSAPTSYADTFLIYNTWECPRDSKKNAGTPCFVAGTPVDLSKLELLRKAPGDARSEKLSMTTAECGPAYGTILMRARNAFGASAFTIVDAALVPDPRDIIC